MLGKAPLMLLCAKAVNLEDLLKADQRHRSAAVRGFVGAASELDSHQLDGMLKLDSFHSISEVLD